MRAIRCLLVLAALAAASPAPAEEVLVVGTKEAPPFSMKDADGGWTGMSIELFERAARELGLSYRYEERDLAGLIDGVAAGDLDVAVAALTMTREREERVDFTHPVYQTGLGIAVPAREEGGLSAVLRRVFSLDLLGAVGGLLALLFGIGFLVWLFERRRNREQFGGPAARGLGAGMWWSAVTMTTVGYGDKAPVTLGGRAIGLVWMFASIILISFFTASIASSLTVSRLASPVQGPEDLHEVTTAFVEGSTSEDWLARRGLRRLPCADLREALRAVEEGRAGAAVHDAPILKWMVRQESDGRVTVLPRKFELQLYGFALTQGSPHREALNREILKLTASDFETELRSRYLGD